MLLIPVHASQMWFCVWQRCWRCLLCERKMCKQNLDDKKAWKKTTPHSHVCMVQHLISPCDINFQHGCTCHFRNLVTCNTIPMVDCTMCVHSGVVVWYTPGKGVKSILHIDQRIISNGRNFHIAGVYGRRDMKKAFTWWRFWIVYRFIFKWYIVCASHLTKSAISLPSNNYYKCDRKWKF